MPSAYVCVWAVVPNATAQSELEIEGISKSIIVSQTSFKTFIFRWARDSRDLPSNRQKAFPEKIGSIGLVLQFLYLLPKILLKKTW